MPKGAMNDSIHIFLTDEDLSRLESGQEVCYEEIISGYSIYIKKSLKQGVNKNEVSVQSYKI